MRAGSQNSSEGDAVAQIVLSPSISNNLNSFRKKSFLNQDAIRQNSRFNVLFVKFRICFLFGLVFLSREIQLNGQDYDIPNILFSNAYTDNPSPISGCTHSSVCVKIQNYTDNPYYTLFDTKIQIFVDPDEYDVIDPFPFVNTGQQDPVFGHHIYETTQDLISFLDPAWNDPEDDWYHFCMKVRKISTQNHKSGFKIKIILSSGPELEYYTGFMHISSSLNTIGVDENSVTHLSSIAWVNSPSYGFLLYPDAACYGDQNRPLQQNFVLNGKLIVDIYYCFLGNIYMGDGAVIEIAENINCDIGDWSSRQKRSTIDACGNMWRTIKVGEGARLAIHHVDIQNALYGTELLSNSILSVNDSEYRNNYIGVRNSESQNNVVVSSGTDFIFEGSFRPNCWNCQGERHHDRAFTGMVLENSNVFVTASDFKFLINGIRLFNSNLQIDNSDFFEIWDYGTNNYGPGSSALNHHGKGIHAASIRGNNVTVSNCNFNAGNWGVYTRGVNAAIKENGMSSVLTGMQFDHSPGRSFDIKGNAIIAEARGINFSWTGSVQSATVNEQNNIEITGTNGIGLDIQHTHGPVKLFYQNNIQIGNGYKGINHTDSENSWIYNNSIYAGGQGTNANTGIHIAGGSTTLTACNNLNSTMNCHNEGIFVSESRENYVLKNQANGWLYDMQYFGTSTGTVFAANRMGNANHGLILGFPQGSYSNPALSARIGVQEQTGNRWIGTHFKGADHYGPSLDRILSKFIVNAQDPQNPDLKPNNFHQLVALQFFEHAEGSAQDLNCLQGIGSGSSSPWPRVFPRSDDEYIAIGDFDTTLDWGSRIWSDQRQLYAQLLNRGGTNGLPAIYGQFYQDQAETSVGIFETIEHELREAFQSGSEVQGDINLKIHLEDSLTNLIYFLFDSVNIETDSAIRVALLDQIESYRTTIVSYRDEIDSLATVLNSQLMQELTSIQILNQSAPSAANYEQNQKTINGLMLQKMISDDWSFGQSERSVIDSIAARCPTFDGPAVYRARALAAIWNMERYDDEEICTEIASQRTRKFGEGKLSDIRIWPNPVNDQFFLSGNGISTVDIFDMNGKPILSQVYKNPVDQMIIQTRDWVSGIYIAKINTINNRIYSIRLVK